MSKKQLHRTSYISESSKERLIIQQKGRCAYCNTSLVGLTIQWDHFIPFAYLGNNPDNNWVASCTLCNAVKSSRVFSSEKDVTKFCLDMIKDHGSFGDGWPEGAEAAWPFIWAE